MRTFKFHPRVKFTLEILALILLCLVVSKQGEAQTKPVTANKAVADAALIDKIIARIEEQKWLDSIIATGGGNTYISPSVGVNPVTDQTSVVPGPVMTSTTTQSGNSSRLGMRQAIIFTPRGNTRLVTVIRIR